MKPLSLGVALALALAACGDLGSILVVDQDLPAPAAEEGRVAEAVVSLPTTMSFSYDIGMSGFASEGPIDLAILREYCRPGRLMEVRESPIPGMGMLTGEMYTPRSVGIRCAPSGAPGDRARPAGLTGAARPTAAAGGPASTRSGSD
jgi:hypothetical protein